MPDQMEDDTMAGTGDDVCNLARSRVGGRYVLGTSVNKADRNASVFDCAELGSWAVYQASGRLFGCADDRGNPTSVDAYTGFWARDARTSRCVLSPDQAAGIRGAILLREPVAGSMGHLAVSDGIGGTYEAANGEAGVVHWSARGRTWTMGIVVPWLRYRVGPPIDLHAAAAQASIWPTRGESSARVLSLQQALQVHGVPLAGVTPGIYDAATSAAVIAFQRARSLTVDDEVGPSTRRALGLA